MNETLKPRPAPIRRLDRWTAHLAPVAHGLFVAVLICGALQVVRRPRFAKIHLPLVAAMSAVAGTGSDCPLTVIEQNARERAGLERHPTGFVSHYLVEPFHPAGITPAIRKALIAAWVIPNLVGYAAAIRRPRSEERGRLSAITR